MTCFVTGSTGYVGQALARRLAGLGFNVHALYRSDSKAGVICLPGIRRFRGNLMDTDSIKQAMSGCRYVFHTGAKTGIWCKKKHLYQEINVQGTKNILKCASELDVEKMIITSTAGVFGPSSTPLDESYGYASRVFSEYERTKAEADRIAQFYSGDTMKIVIVHPTRIYGPGPLSQSNSVTRMIQLYITGKWHFLLGNGKKRGNYVYIDDVVDGHIAALKKGRSGENYILGGENSTYQRFFDLLSIISRKSRFLIRIPIPVALNLSRMMLLTAELFNIPPALTPEMVKKLNSDCVVRSSKAEKELGYSPASLHDGLQKTVNWILAGEDNNNNGSK